MKTLSQRCEVVVVGSGLSGICAAVGAAREGATVSLIESRLNIGGKIGQGFLFPYDFEGTSNFVYQRETGLLDEILNAAYGENLEGNYCGQERGLLNFVLREKRLNLFLGSHLFDVQLNSREDKIDSVTTFSNRTGDKVFFKASYFIDCSGKGILAELAKASGEKGLDVREYKKSSASGKPFQFRAASSMEVGISRNSVPFVCPSWATMKWETNEPSAQLDLLESLSNGIEGFHNVEWLGKVKNVPSLSSAHLIWSAWDYLKNRSQLKDRARNWVIKDFSPLSLSSESFRGEGLYKLVPQDLETGKDFKDSVALGRGPLDSSDSLLFSPRGKVALPRPFQIPLRCLISSKVKNLFLTGQQASVTSRVSASLAHPPTAAQTGESAGVCAAYCISRKCLPKTIVKDGNIQAFQRRLNRLNHSFSLNSVEDLGDLITSANVVASTELKESFSENSLEETTTTIGNGLIQFPVSSKIIDEIYILLEAAYDVELEYRILEGASAGSTIPGNCLLASSLRIKKGKPRWEKFPVSTKINNKGWHYLEFLNADGISFYQQNNCPVGTLLFLPLKDFKTGILNPFSHYFPALNEHHKGTVSIAAQVSPRQKIYSAENVQNGKNRPDNLPNLWISEETDFRFPEFLEFHWAEPVDISSIDIVWDSSLEFLFPNRPQALASSVIPSVVSAYKIYFMNEVGHWEELIYVSGNTIGFSSHSFENISTRAIEIEILKTNGLNRAQIYEVRAYS